VPERSTERARISSRWPNIRLAKRVGLTPSASFGLTR
jgi:hypothetical protein